MNTKNTLPIGTLLRGGTYRVDRQLASGGFGNTYVVTNMHFGETYAMKEFYIRGVNEREEDSRTVSVSNGENMAQFALMKEKFWKEAVRLRKLNSPHVVRVYDLFDENSTTYYVMDYIDGESMSAMLKRTGKPLAEDKALACFKQVLDALEAIHKENIWHLDLKPGNVMVDKHGNAVLIDFGASKQFRDSEGHSLSTSTGLCYTPGYAPLEQTDQNYKQFGPWTDFYALGATMYNVLTNETPPSSTIILTDDDALCLPPSVSDKTKELIRWLMSPGYKKRPQNVQAIRAFMMSYGRASDDETLMNHLYNQSHNPIMSQEKITDDAARKLGQTSTPNYVSQRYSQSPSAYSPGRRDGNDGKSYLYAIIGFLVFCIIGGGLYLISHSKNNSEQSIDAATQNANADLSQNDASTYEEQETVVAPVASQQQYTIEGSHHLSGAISKYGVTMELTVNGSSVSGSYYYHSQGSKHRLTIVGYVQGNNMELEEYAPDGSNTGGFAGVFNGQSYKGTFTNYNRGTNMSFSLVVK